MADFIAKQRKRGEQTPEGRKRSLDNLIPIKPGTSGNPAGRPAAGLTLKELVNEMQGWPKEKLRAIMKDPSASVARKAAARVWLHAGSARMNSAGMPIAGADFDRICDRTIGKPMQSVEHSGQDGADIKIAIGVKVQNIEQCASEFESFAISTRRGVGKEVLPSNGN